MLEVTHLTKYYGDKLGVEDVTFSIQKGEIVGLLGPNGAGKSTIMKMITGYIPPTAGTVTVDGFDVVEHPREVSRRIGFLPEIPPLYPEMAVEEFLTFLAQIRGVAKGERRAHVAEVLELASIAHVKDRLIRNLSKGYRQRVGLGQALIGLPEILILDEPTVGLDPKQITEVRDLIKRLSQRHTIILSSHILSEVSSLCEKIIIINRGKLVTMDTMEHLERQAAVGSGFLLRVRGRTEEVRPLLEGLPGLTTLEDQPPRTGEEGVCRFLLRGEGDEALREAAFRACARADRPILELRTVGAGLEDVFLALTAAAPAPEADGEEESP